VNTFYAIITTNQDERTSADEVGLSFHLSREAAERCVLYDAQCDWDGYINYGEADDDDHGSRPSTFIEACDHFGYEDGSFEIREVDLTPPVMDADVAPRAAP